MIIERASGQKVDVKVCCLQILVAVTDLDSLEWAAGHPSSVCRGASSLPHSGVWCHPLHHCQLDTPKRVLVTGLQPSG